jgi:2-methylcitrate dehydratase
MASSPSVTPSDAAGGGERRARPVPHDTQVDRLAQFVCGARFEDISEPAREQLKLRVLDSLGCALGALDGEPVRIVAAQVREFGGAPLATLIGAGKSAPDRAALYNGALVRYLDFNDSFLAPGETCHPSDNLAPVLAAADYAHAEGRTFLAALAVAYQVQNRLSEVAPVRAKGFDHTTQGAYAVAAGVSRALGLDPPRTANAIAIAGTSLNALRVTRTGFIDAIAGPFEIDWQHEGLESVRRTILKRFNAEIHSQSAIEALLELRAAHDIETAEVERIELETFQVAYDIIGGGEEGSKYEIATKEEADHSLPFLLAVALLDGQVLPEQYRPERIAAPDVQELLRRVEVRPDDELSKRFPDEHSARIRVHMRDGGVLEREQHDYQGFHSRPMSWDAVEAKFDRLASLHVDDRQRTRIKDAVARLDAIGIDELTSALAAVTSPTEGRSP